MRCLSLLSVAVVTLSAAWGEEPAAFLQRWATAEASASSIKVSFTQEVKNPALQDAVKSEGRMWRFADGAFRWELGQPARTMLIKNGSTFRLWEAESNVWTNLDEKDRRFRMWVPFLTGKGVSPEAMTKEFTATLSADAGLSVLTLVPRSGMARKYLKSIQIAVEGSTMHLKQLTVTQADGGESRMRFAEPAAVSDAERKTVLGE